MFSVIRHYPVLELLFSNSPIALILTRNKQLKLYKLKLILGKFFLCEDGWFIVDSSQSFGHFRQKAYLFIADCPNPVPMSILQKLEKISKKSNYDKFLSEIDRLKKVHEDDGQEDGYTKDELKTLSTLNPISNLDPAEIQILKNYSEVDPQTLSTGLNAIVNIDKLFKRRSKTIGTNIPMGLIIIVIAVIAVMLLFGENIADMLTNSLGGMGIFPVDEKIVGETAEVISETTKEAVNTVSSVDAEVVKDPEIIKEIESELNEDVINEEDKIIIETSGESISKEESFVNPSIDSGD